jgi:hypothetical protein
MGSTRCKFSIDFSQRWLVHRHPPVVINDAVAARHIMVTRGYFYGKHDGIRVVFRSIEGSIYGMGSLEGELKYSMRIDL